MDKVKEAMGAMDVKDPKDFMNVEERKQLEETEKLKEVKSQAATYLTTAAANLFEKEDLSRYREETFPILVSHKPHYHHSVALRVIICTAMEPFEVFKNDLKKSLRVGTEQSVNINFLQDSKGRPEGPNIYVNAESLHGILRLMQARPGKDMLEVSCKPATSRTKPQF